MTRLLCHLSLNDGFPGDCDSRSSLLPAWSSPAGQVLLADSAVLQGWAASAASQTPSAPTLLPSQLQGRDELLRARSDEVIWVQDGTTVPPKPFLLCSQRLGLFEITFYSGQRANQAIY